MTAVFLIAGFGLAAVVVALVAGLVNERRAQREWARDNPRAHAAFARPTAPTTPTAPTAAEEA